MSEMQHALLGASSASRWIACPPSARLTEPMEDKGSVYAEEGTLAHALAENRLSSVLTGQALPLLSTDDAEMEAAAQTYVDAIQEIISTFPYPPYVITEQTVDFSRWVPEGFGTADCILIGDRVLHVVDYKYGKGVRVDAEDNPQLRLYALGALARYQDIYDISTVCMTIIQPRLDHISTVEVFKESLLQWAEDTVAPAAKLAFEGAGYFNPGDHCRFCKARATCRARSDYMLSLEGFNKVQPPLLTKEEVSEALNRGRNLVSWLNDLESYALTQLLCGQEIPGWKAVEGRSVRAWTDAEAAFNKALELGTPEEMLYERKPVSLAALEKVMGKKAFSPLNDYVTVPPGKPALAQTSDKRPAIIAQPTAEDDFAE